jgi:hypothetical protein
MHGILLAALDEVKLQPPADLPAGPPLFRYSQDDALAQSIRVAFGNEPVDPRSDRLCHSKARLAAVAPTGG